MAAAFPSTDQRARSISAIWAILSVLGWSWAALRAVLKHLAGSWGGLGCLFEPLGAVLGSLGRLLGRLEGVLGPLGRLLGRLRGDQNVTKIKCPKKANFQTPKRRVLLRYGGGFGRPKSSKIGPQTAANLRRFSRAKKMLFKSLLEPSWADLGPFWRPSWAPNMRSRTRGLVFGENSRF